MAPGTPSPTLHVREAWKSLVVCGLVREPVRLLVLVVGRVAAMAVARKKDRRASIVEMFLLCMLGS